MIPVGVYENVKFSAKKNDQGSLQIVAEVVQPEAELDLDAVTLESEGELSNSFLIYGLKMEGYENGALVANRSKAAINTDIKDLRGLLTFILSLYMPLEDIKWNLFEGTDLTKENQDTDLYNDESLKAVYNNLVNQFISQLNEVEDPDKLFRAVFPRQSKLKHFPKLRNKYLDKQPFAEPMDIPAEQSKVGFTPGEIKAELHIPDVIQPGQSKEDKDTSNTLGI